MTITGQYGTQSTDLSRWFASRTNIWQAFVGVAILLFTEGRPGGEQVNVARADCQYAQQQRQPLHFSKEGHMAFVQIHKSVEVGKPNDWRLNFQYVTYHYDADPPEMGYRFIWRRPNGHLQGARGQARIPDAETLFRLLAKASAEGWFVAIEAQAAKLLGQVPGGIQPEDEADDSAPAAVIA